MSEPNLPGNPPAGSGPSRPRRDPAHLLISVIVAVLFIGVPVGAVQGLAPWMQSKSAALLPQPSSGLSSRPANTSALDTGVVDINTQLGYLNAAGAGTGIVLSPSGEVLTNNHVISGATRISVTDVGTGRRYPATVTGYDRSHDIALLQVHGASGLPTAPIGDSSTVSVGDKVAAVGNAGGLGGSPSIASGTVTALDRTITASDGRDGSIQQLTGLIQIAANVVPGDSGGPLVNTAGQVVGIDTAASTGFRLESAARGKGFAIPINDALAITRQIEAGAGSATVHIGPTGVLGILVQDTARYGLAVSGATVAGVLPGLPGDQAELAAGDVIVAVDDTAVDSAASLTTVLNSHHPGDSVRLTWLDPSGQQHDATVRLAAGPPN
ncbi:MAG TPA: trypsin-like peptidase domain-containing protein [Pseudonocardiaceae bacterium]|nr:trypsin-like peptidase domain-containing protein [Pseudonocardiaceae bacterium]